MISREETFSREPKDSLREEEEGARSQCDHRYMISRAETFLENRKTVFERRKKVLAHSAITDI
jgi:hypothetical protein